jgi:hypothetical protein
VSVACVVRDDINLHLVPRLTRGTADELARSETCSPMPHSEVGRTVGVVSSPTNGASSSPVRPTRP